MSLKEEGTVCFNDYSANNYLINNFECIGWTDPNDMSETKLEMGPFDLVYPEERYVDDHSPFCIYIPSKPIMVKLMKACIGC
jgi:hypothetical protein